MQVSQEVFNEIMRDVLNKLRLNPQGSIADIAEEACEPYKHLFGGNENDFDILVFQVVQNLVNASR